MCTSMTYMYILGYPFGVYSLYGMISDYSFIHVANLKLAIAWLLGSVYFIKALDPLEYIDTADV